MSGEMHCSDWSDALFSRTRQNSRVLWLSSVDSRSTETFGSVCFSRRYIGPVGRVRLFKATLLTYLWDTSVGVSNNKQVIYAAMKFCSAKFAY